MNANAVRDNYSSASNTKGEREKILGRIREALRVIAPIPGIHIERDKYGAAVSTQQNFKPQSVAAMASRWLPATGENFEDHVALFRTNATELRADFRLLDSQDALAVELRKISEAEGWKKIASHRAELTDAACAALAPLPTIRTDSGYDVHEFESCDAGITECDALIAQTGSVLITSRSAGGRALSVLPPHHVVVAHREQLLADLPTAFRLLKIRYAASSYPSFISLITGPSRTGDIERVLVLGAHGPKKLTILCA